MARVIIESSVGEMQANMPELPLVGDRIRLDKDYAGTVKTRTWRQFRSNVSLPFYDGDGPVYPMVWWCVIEVADEQ